jgi:hypothetical protein
MKIFNTEVYGLEESLIASGYPKSTKVENIFNVINHEIIGNPGDAIVDINDSRHFKRSCKLGNTSIGSGHNNFLSGIIVQCDIEAPSYWWPEFQRYHFAQIVSSQSKMHMITKFDIEKQCNAKTWAAAMDIAKTAIKSYQDGNIDIDEMLCNIPMGLELTARVSMNYLQLKTMYAQRKDHGQIMWREIFCSWVKTLPHTKELGVIR